MFAYREIAPAARLAPYVKCFWALRSISDHPRTERILPDASLELIFQLGDPFANQPRAMVVGEVRRAVVVQPSRNADVFGVRFHPGGAAPFVRMPVDELRDLMLPMREVFDVEQQIYDASSTTERIATIESMLTRNFREPATHRTARVAASLIARRHGTLRIREVARIIGTTERSLERAFDTNIGVTAKTYSRLMRFHSYLRGESDGYFDDSHRIRDFHEFSGVTPSQWRSEQNAMNDAFVGNVQD